MRTIGDPRTLGQLRRRVETLPPDAARQWGKMNVQQMLAHLARSMEWVLDGEESPWPHEPSRLVKFMALRLPLPWPKGVPNPNDPASVDVPAEDFEPLQERVLRGLDELSRWEASADTPAHPAFGALSTWEWRRWAFKHADHHLKQFGV